MNSPEELIKLISTKEYRKLGPVDMEIFFLDISKNYKEINIPFDDVSWLLGMKPETELFIKVVE